MAFYKCADIHPTGKNIAFDSASGSIANFNTQLAMPISLKAYIEATQDLRGQSGSYPAGCGINKWNGEWEQGGINSTTGIDENQSTQWRTVGYIAVQPSTEYYICTPTGVDNKSIRPRFYDADKNYIGYTVASGSGVTNRKFTTPSDCYFMRFTPTEEHVLNHDISLNNPSSDTDYHPYSNICPIGGFSEIKIKKCSRNLLPNKTYQRTVNHVVIGQDNADNEIYLKAGSYVINIESDLNPSLYIQGDTTPQTGIGSQYPKTFTLDKSEKYRFQVYKSTGITPEDITSFQLEIGSTPSDYEAYNGNIITIALGDTYYGGYFTQNKDGKRQFKCTHKISKFSDLPQPSYNSTWNFYEFSVADAKQDNPTNVVAPGLMCECYTPRTAQQAGSGDMDASISLYALSPKLRVKDKRFVNDATSLVNDIGNHRVVYPLETPIIIDLPDGDPINSLPGVNNIFNDSGDTEINHTKLSS